MPIDLSDLAPTCGSLGDPPGCVTFIGGAQLCAPTIGLGVDDPLLQGLAQLGQIGLVGAPLSPLMICMNIVTDIFDIFKDLPNFVAVAGDVENLAIDIASLVSMAIPGVPFVGMALGMVKAVRFTLVGLVNYITNLINRYQQVANSLTKAQAVGDLNWIRNAQCAKSNLDAEVAALNQKLLGIGFVLGFINLILCFAQQPPIAVNVDLSGELAEVLAPLNITIAALDQVIAVLSAIALPPPVALKC